MVIPTTGRRTGTAEEQLDAEIAEYRASMLATSTKATYSSQLRRFLDFCVTFGYQAVPVTDITLCRYVAFLARNIKYNSVRQYLSVIRLLHLEFGLSNPMLDNWLLQSVLKGIRKVKGSTVTPKLPITPDLLLQFHSLLDPSSSSDLAFWAACLLMFFGLFRKSNVFSPLTGFTPGKHLSFRDFHSPQGKGHLLLISRWSKNNQYRERTLETVLPALPGHPLCPVSAITAAVLLNPPSSPSGPALWVRTGGSTTPYSYPMFLRSLRAKLSKLGYQASAFATHSFRRGGATWAFRIGIPGEVIKMMGDWHSPAYLGYIEVTQDLRQAASLRFASALPYTTIN